MRRPRGCVAGALAVVALCVVAHAAGAQVFNPRDDRYRALGFMRARAEYERATAEWERARALRARELLSAAELEQADAARVRARVDLLQQALAAMDAAPHVLIERARKRRTRDGGTEVELALAGAPNADEEVGALLGALDEGLRREVARQGAGRLFVSLKAAPGPDGTVIATPYERVLPRLAAGARARTTFRLVRDAADVVVSLDHGGRLEERRILLEADGGAGGIALDVLQPALEADLGAQATFDVTVERLRDDVAAVRVGIEGLPPNVAGEVRAADSDARLAVVRWALGERAKRLRVLVALPREATGGVRVDSALHFVVVAEPAASDGGARGARGARGASGASGAGGPPGAGAAAVRAGIALVPRGVPRAELRLSAAWAEVRAGDTVRAVATVRNAGTRALAGVRAVVEAPPGWRVQATPPTVALAVGDEVPVALTIVPDAAAGAGDWEARVRLEGGAGERPLESEPRLLRVRVVPAGRAWSAWAVAAVLLAGAALAVRAGRRLMAR